MYTLLHMAFQPLGERILVEPQEPEALSPGGIIIPEISQDKPQMGKVLAVGKEILAKVLKPGDLVLFGKYAGLTIQLNYKEHLILDLSEVLGIVTEDK